MMTEERGGLAFRRAVEQAGFARLSHLIVTDPDLSDGAVRLYARLLWYARQDIRCWPGRDRLAHDLNVSKPTIDRRLAELVDRGLITREQRLNQSAMTWIEDLAEVYKETVDNSVPIKNDKDVPIKNDKDMSLSNLIGKEETEEETDMNGGDDINKNIATKTTTLTAFGVSQSVAEHLAQQRSLEEIKGWLEYAARADGLRNPVAFVVSRLQRGEPVPERKGNNGDERRRDIDGKYAKYIKH